MAHFVNASAFADPVALSSVGKGDLFPWQQAPQIVSLAFRRIDLVLYERFALAVSRSSVWSPLLEILITETLSAFVQQCLSGQVISYEDVDQTSLNGGPDSGKFRRAARNPDYPRDFL